MKMTRRIALITLVAMLGLVGCGDDDDDTNASTDDTDTSTDDSGDAADGDVEAYCGKSLEIETAPEPDVDFESATPEEVSAAVKDYASTLLVIAHEAQDAAPTEIQEDIELLVGVVEDAAETGSTEGFESTEFSEAEGRVHAYELDACGWQQVDVSAVNYAFEGIPDELDAGVTSFEFANNGTELHELVIIRKNDDTTESFEELLALPEGEAETKTTFVTAAFGEPGAEGEYSVADLEAGEYIGLCFIPVGTVDENTQADGPPHFTQGMQHTFTVS